MFAWQDLDQLTRVAVVCTGTMVLLLIVPPLALLVGLIGLVVGGVAFRRSLAEGRANPTAQWCMMICGVLFFLLIVGNLLYASRA